MFFKRLRKSARANGQASQLDAPPSYVGQDVVVEGSLVSAGELHIDGTVHGNARAQAVVVDRHGAVHGEVAGEEVLVRGGAGSVTDPIIPISPLPSRNS